MVERLWEGRPAWGMFPVLAPWRYISRKPYLRMQVSLGGVSLGGGVLAVGVLVAASSVPLGTPAILAGVPLAAAAGTALGWWTWQRERLRFEAGVPIHRFSGRVWVLCATLLIALLLTPLVEMMLILQGSSALVDALTQAESTLAVLLIAAGIASWAVRGTSIARYERSKGMELVAESVGNSSIDVREIRLFWQPRMS